MTRPARILLGLFVLTNFSLTRTFAQVTREITAYDDESLRSIAIPDLIRNLEDALNIISFKGAEPLDFKVIKTRLFNDSEMPRTFFSERVIVESDLHFDDWSNAVKTDLDARQYIDNFNLIYPKTQDPSVSFKVKGISSLKKREYLYYNVIFESVFENKDVYGNRFVPVTRLAEIRIEFDSVWVPYINVIRFTPEAFDLTDPRNDFKGFANSSGKGADARLEMLSKLRGDERQSNTRMDALMLEGQRLMDARQYDAAVKVFQRARMLDPDNKELNARIHTCDSIIDADVRARRILEERAARIRRLRALAVKSFQDHFIIECKEAIDSLEVNYGVDDPEIKRIRSRLSKVLPFINQMVIIESGKDYELGLEYSTRIVRNADKGSSGTDSLLVSEALYWSGKMYYNIDSLRAEDAAAYCKEALAYSADKHLPARMLLVKTRLYRKRNKLEALEIATAMVDAEPRNPELRALRAYVYEYLQDYDNALKEYQLAIQLNTEYPSVYISKARLEIFQKRYPAGSVTAASGLQAFPCDDELSYLRVLALDLAGLYNDAGKAYQEAEVCGWNGLFRDEIIGRGAGYFKKGMVFFDSGNDDSAAVYLSRSFELTRNKDALFYRGLLNFRKKSFEKALTDYNRLIQLDSSYTHAYYMRGLTKAAMGNHESAINDYRVQFELAPGYWKTYAACAGSEYVLGRYQTAAAYYERCNALNYTDSIAAQTIKACYRAALFSKGILLAREYSTVSKAVNFELIKYLGLCEYEQGLYKEAEGDLSEALKLTVNDFESTLYLSKTLFARNQFDKADRFAVVASGLCADCPKALVWSITTSFLVKDSERGNRTPDRMELAIYKDTSLITATNFAWLAYGFFVVGGDKEKASRALRSSENISSDDPVGLFVRACMMAKETDDTKQVTSLLSKACSSGFRQSKAIESFPDFRKFRSDDGFSDMLRKCARQ